MSLMIILFLTFIFALILTGLGSSIIILRLRKRHNEQVIQQSNITHGLLVKTGSLHEKIFDQCKLLQNQNTRLSEDNRKLVEQLNSTNRLLSEIQQPMDNGSYQAYIEREERYKNFITGLLLERNHTIPQIDAMLVSIETGQEFEL